MGSNSPSHYRREGRNAFHRHGNPAEYNPYADKLGYTAEMHSSDWLEGWREAAQHDELAKAQEARDAVTEEEKIEEFARLYLAAKERGLI